MKRHAPGGYEPHGPPQHQVRPHLPQQTRPAQCTLVGQLAVTEGVADGVPACTGARLQRRR